MRGRRSRAAGRAGGARARGCRSGAPGRSGRRAQRPRPRPAPPRPPSAAQTPFNRSTCALLRCNVDRSNDQHLQRVNATHRVRLSDSVAPTGCGGCARSVATAMRLESRMVARMALRGPPAMLRAALACVAARFPAGLCVAPAVETAVAQETPEGRRPIPADPLARAPLQRGRQGRLGGRAGAAGP